MGIQYLAEKNKISYLIVYQWWPFLRIIFCMIWLVLNVRVYVNFHKLRFWIVFFHFQCDIQCAPMCP